MNDDGDDYRDYDYFAPKVIAAREAVGKAISDYIGTIRPDDAPYVVAWAVAAEWTNRELEQTGRAGRDTISPSEQTISATVGLGSHLVARYQ